MSNDEEILLHHHQLRSNGDRMIKFDDVEQVVFECTASISQFCIRLRKSSDAHASRVI